MTKRVYLAGPMVGLTKEEMNAWRTELTTVLGNRGISTINPTRRIPFGGEGYDSAAYAKYVFESDLRDIQQSDAVFFDVRQDSGRGAGTQMEVMYSWMLHKKMYLWTGIKDFKHPFYTGMNAIIGANFYSLAERLIIDLSSEARQEALISDAG